METTQHARANEAYCTCGRRFYVDMEQAEHARRANMTELERAREDATRRCCEHSCADPSWRP